MPQPSWLHLRDFFRSPLNLGLVGMVAMVGYFAYSAFWPFATLEPRVQPYHVLTGQVKIGQPIVYEADYCKRTSAPALVTRALVSDNGTVVSLSSIPTNLPAGCHRVNSATTLVPPATLPGRYKLALTLTYHVNALRDITVAIETEYFTVTP
jgi:hypothetical protein